MPTSTLRKKSFCTSSARIDMKVGGAMSCRGRVRRRRPRRGEPGSSALTALAYWRTCSRPTTKESGYSWTIPRISVLRAMRPRPASRWRSRGRRSSSRPRWSLKRDRYRLGLGINGFHPAVEDDLGALAVVGHRHHGGESHVVLGDRGRVADPRGDVAAAEAHGQHAVRDGGVEADLLGDLVVPVDRVEVTGYAGVVHQVPPGQRDDLLRQLIADLDRTELTQCHR